MNCKRIDNIETEIINDKIVVFSKSYEATLGIARSLKIGGATDIDLFYVGYNSIVVKKSNVFHNKYFCEKDDQTIIDNLVNTYRDVKGTIILFPGDDYTTSLADMYRERLKDKFIYTYAEPKDEETIIHLMDKLYQYNLSKEFNLPMAQSCVLSTSNGIYKISDDIKYPCFVKPLISANGPAKSIIRKIEDEENLTSYLLKLTKKGYFYPVLVQEFIDIEEEYNIHGICDGDRIFLPVIHQKLETAKFNKGVTILGKNLNPDHLGDNIDKLKEMLLSCKYHGIFNVEMFKSKGVVYLNEINFRIAGTCWGTTGAGANLPYLWVNVLMGRVVDWPQLKLKYDTVFINDKTAMEDLLNGYCGLSSYLSWNRSASFHLIKNKSDKGPWYIFFRKLVRAYLGRTKVKLLNILKN